jgi:isoquinoline 1-oxidoreductase beta subunit
MSPDAAGRTLTRRRFLQIGSAAGAGLVLGISLQSCRSGEPDIPPGDGTDAFNAWLRIGRDDSVTFRVSESEMGQGVMTSLAMALVEELEADWDRVKVEHAPTDRIRYGWQSTGGSTSIRNDFELMRRAGASAREMLVAAAAVAWAVPADECRVERGIVRHAGSGQEATFGSLAGAAAALPIPKDPPLKRPEEFRLVGMPVKRVDSRAKVSGVARFGQDVSVPGMLVAQVVHPPTFGGRVRSFDDRRARLVPGVHDVIEIPTGVAIVADHFWAAKLGRDALEIDWEVGSWGDLSSERITETCRSVVRMGKTARDEGDAEGALSRAATRVEAVYEVPYLAHATMEPMNCTVHVGEDLCDVWVGTQAQRASQDLACEITGFDPAQVHLQTMYLGGGFGRRSQTDFVRDAVHVSKAVGRPVKVLWTREDDMRAGYYRPVSYSEMAGAVDADGWPVAWIHRMATPSIAESMGQRIHGIDGSAIEGASDHPYAIPNVLVTCAHPRLPLPLHWWRAVGHSQNAFLVESFLDELARAGGKDPAELRHRLLEGHPRHQHILDILVERSGWGGTLPEGQARGIAVHQAFGTLVGQVADVSLDSDGSVHVHRVVCAVDCGQVVNPNTIIAQMESGICFGLSAALWGGLKIRNGQVVEGNFDRYRVVRMREMPRVETYVVPSGDSRGGIGETGVPPIAPAVCNALLALTGTPVRRLPIEQLA